MADSIREKILKNIVTTLQGITVAAGYNNTVVTVSRQKKDVLEATPTKLPMLVIFPGSDEPTELFGDLLNRELFLTILAWIRSATDLEGKLESFIADVQKVMAVDYTRATLAIDTQEEETIYLHLEEDDKEGGASIAYTIKYRTKRTDPTQ